MKCRKIEDERDRLRAERNKLARLGRAYLEANRLLSLAQYAMGERLEGEQLELWRSAYMAAGEAQAALDIELWTQHYHGVGGVFTR